MKGKIFLAVTFLSLIFVGCASSDEPKSVPETATEQTVTEVQNGIEYKGVTISETECLLNRISFTANATAENCETLIIPEQLEGYKVVEIAGIDEGEDTVRNVFGDIAEPHPEDGWVCKEENNKSEELVREIVLPDTVNKLSTLCFGGLRNLERITLSQSVKVIEGNVFRDTDKLKELNVPATLEQGLENLVDTKWTNFMLDSENARYKVENGLLLSKDGKRMYGIVSDASSFVIPGAVSELAEGALNTEESSDIRVAEDNATYAKDGQCIYRKDNSELIAVISDKGEFVLSEKIKLLKSPVMVCGPRVKKIVYSADGKADKDFAIESLEGESWQDYNTWLSEKLSSGITWDVRGRTAPTKYSPADFGMKKVIVCKEQKKVYKRWIAKYKEWSNPVEIEVSE